MDKEGSHNHETQVIAKITKLRYETKTKKRTKLNKLTQTI